MIGNNRIIIFILSAVSLLVLTAFGYSKSGRTFPHTPHMDSDMECTECHAKAAKSKKAGDNNLPDLTNCMDCHDKDIFKIFTMARSKPGYQLEFNHELHAGKGLKCLGCHNGIKKETFIPGSAYPPMDLCLKCHNNKNADKKCSKCHKEKVQFPHKTHIDASLECDSCHTKIAESIKTDRQRDIPGKKSCNDCHDKKDGYFEITAFLYSQTYRFNHAFHIEEQGVECNDCHQNLLKKNKIRRDEVVKDYKDCCIVCHDNETASGYCMYCHITPIKPDDHQPNFDKQHKLKASSDLKTCISCHTEKGFCGRCHTGNRKPLNTHNPNFELTHRFESRVALKNCKSCHTERYCKNCHTSRGVTSAAEKYMSPHPTGWLTTGSSNFHKRKARLKLSSCTSCHTKNDCYYCHFTKRRR